MSSGDDDGVVGAAGSEVIALGDRAYNATHEGIWGSTTL
jgi:hypothetical protein